MVATFALLRDAQSLTPDFYNWEFILVVATHGCCEGSLARKRQWLRCCSVRFWMVQKPSVLALCIVVLMMINCKQSLMQWQRELHRLHARRVEPKEGFKVAEARLREAREGGESARRESVPVPFVPGARQAFVALKAQ